MKLDWTKHLKEDLEKQTFEAVITASRPVLDRLKDILNEYEKSLDRSETDLSTYETSNWAYKQAHKNGYRACLNRIQELVDLDQRIIKI